MRTGLSYMGHHNPKHMQTDLKDIKRLACDDVFLAIQENDFAYFDGKIRFFPKITLDMGINPIAIFWGLLNCFGGGRSSQFLLENPKAHQVHKDGSHNPNGCYNNPDCMAYIKRLINKIAEHGFQGYFIDEPSVINCYCDSCLELYDSMHEGNLHEASADAEQFFRKKCIVRYVCLLADYIKINHPQMQTMCCMMPQDQKIWSDIARIDSLDNLGADIYWVNEQTDLEKMRPIVEEMSGLCRVKNKQHHQWLQCWGVKKGNEPRIIDSGKVLISERPQALYVWAYNGQLGTTETCEDPQAAWKAAAQILKQAKDV